MEPGGQTSPDDLTAWEAERLERGLDDVRARMRPLETSLDELRAERDRLLTELRRRQRLRQREGRAGLRQAMQAGSFPTLGELVAGGGSEPLAAYSYHLKTGGEVRLGFPGARLQSLTFTDGSRLAQARDLAEAARLFEAGWELGSPGRPGVRVHFPGTRQERLVGEAEVYARPSANSDGGE